MRVKGHGLQREGRAHDALGRYTGDQVGFGLCQCGAISHECRTNAERQRWHIAHKQDMSKALGPSSWSLR